MPDFSVVAFIPVFNEADILPHVILHLQGQGIWPHIIDNWSTDQPQMPSATPMWSCERFPEHKPPPWYEWERILRYIEERSTDHPRCDWAMLHDADEIRRSRHPGETLREALQRFDRDGATAANFEVFNFWPTDDTWDGTQNPEEHFKYYEQAGIDQRLPHVKAWKNNGQHLMLAQTGGHSAVDLWGYVTPPNRCFLHSESLILKHYPIRSTEQGKRKLFRDRLPRYTAEEKAKGWHVQYNELAKTQEFIRDPKTLKRWAGAET